MLVCGHKGLKARCDLGSSTDSEVLIGLEGGVFAYGADQYVNFSISVGDIADMLRGFPIVSWGL